MRSVLPIIFLIARLLFTDILYVFPTSPSRLKVRHVNAIKGGQFAWNVEVPRHVILSSQLIFSPVRSICFLEHSVFVWLQCVMARGSNATRQTPNPYHYIHYTPQHTFALPNLVMYHFVPSRPFDLLCLLLSLFPYLLFSFSSPVSSISLPCYFVTPPFPSVSSFSAFPLLLFVLNPYHSSVSISQTCAFRFGKEYALWMLWAQFYYCSLLLHCPNESLNCSLLNKQSVFTWLVVNQVLAN
jgi:hypothetical protein